MPQPSKKQGEKPRKTGGLTITRRSAVKRMKRLIATRGLEAAIEIFDAMSIFHREDAGWPAIASAVDDLIIKEKERREKENARTLVVDNRQINMRGNRSSYIENPVIQ